MQLSLFAEMPAPVPSPPAPAPRAILTRRQAERDARHRDVGIALDALRDHLPCQFLTHDYGEDEDEDAGDDEFVPGRCARPDCECVEGDSHSGTGFESDCAAVEEFNLIDATDPADWTPAYAAGVIAAAAGLDDHENPYCPHRAPADFADWRAGRDLQPPVYRP